MAKSKVKTDYIQELHDILNTHAKKLTVKQLRVLCARYALS